MFVCGLIFVCFFRLRRDVEGKIQLIIFIDLEYLFAIRVIKMIIPHVNKIQAHCCTTSHSFQIMDDIYDRFHHLLDSLDLVWLDPEAFAEAVHEKGAPLTGCWGFIDGTPRPIARPVRNQRIMFSGHKRTHCLKFQVYKRC